jgi:hypothetical protein
MVVLANNLDNYPAGSLPSITLFAPMILYPTGAQGFEHFPRQIYRIVIILDKKVQFFRAQPRT